MKKTLLLSLFAIAGLCNAQKKFEGGFKVGYINSTLKLKERNFSETFDAKSSAYVSVPMEYHFNDRVSALLEVGLAGLGGENLIINEQESRLHLTTAYIPLGLKFYPVKGKFNISTGFNLGFTMKALGEQDGEKVEFNNFSSANHSYFVGAEYRFKKNFLAEIKYNIGLSNVAKNQGQTMTNNFLQIGVGYVYDN